jgi:serine/threonine protein kinase
MCKGKVQAQGSSMNGIPTRVLGRGRYGVVVQVHNPLLDRSYAVKVIPLVGDEAQVDLALNECRVLARLEHPNIIRSFGCWIEPDLQALGALVAEVGQASEESAGLSSTVNWTSCSGIGCPSSFPPTKYLFLQMELCDGTLADWCAFSPILLSDTTILNPPPSCESPGKSSLISSVFALKFFMVFSENFKNKVLKT